MNKEIDPEINLSDLFKKLGFGNGKGINTPKVSGYIIPLLIVIAIVVWFATGVYQVGPRENGVVRQFGKFNSIANPGLNWRIPSPVTTVTKVDVQRIRRAELGFRTDDAGTTLRVLDEALMLTTDNSIVEAQMVIQYRVLDPKKFIFGAKDPEKVLRGASEVALRSIMGRTSLDDALTSRSIVEQDTTAFLLKLLDNYNVGIEITEIKLQVVDPPEEVKDAFQDVTRALEEETTLVNTAKQYAAKEIPVAKGQVQVKIREAAAFHQKQIEEATGETARFLALLEEYRNDPIVTRERIYLEKMESVFATVNKTIIDTKVQVLPLLDFAKSSDTLSLSQSPSNDRGEVTNE